MFTPKIIPIGYFTVSGNLCSQSGVYVASNDNNRLVCWKGRIMPKLKGKEVGLILESYWSS